MGRHRTDPSTIRRKGLGTRHPPVDELHRSQSAPARAAPHASRQDEHGGQSRRGSRDGGLVPLELRSVVARVLELDADSFGPSSVKQVLVRGGGVTVEEVPAPEAGPRQLLVRVAYSSVSSGTELMNVKMS